MGVGAAAAAASLLPPSLQQALAAEQPVAAAGYGHGRGRGGLGAINHVVVMMQENRSFDHYFG
ncbi:alkaline phosphatase family protein, partial [Streptomyces rimosus]